MLGGVMLEHLSWHWPFVAGGLPSLVVAALIARLVPESHPRSCSAAGRSAPALAGAPA